MLGPRVGFPRAVDTEVGQRAVLAANRSPCWLVFIVALALVGCHRFLILRLAKKPSPVLTDKGLEFTAFRQGGNPEIAEEN